MRPKLQMTFHARPTGGLLLRWFRAAVVSRASVLLGTGVLLASLVFLPGEMQAQGAGSVSYPAGAPSGGAPIDVPGRVINAATGTPIPRALVRLDGRRVELTDHEGKFNFIAADNPQNLIVQKPGFSANLSNQQSVNHAITRAELVSMVEVLMYPNAELTGVVKSQDGQPMNNVMVSPSQHLIDANGQRTVVLQQTRTNSRGEYRVQLTPGEYTLSFNAFGGFNTGTVVLPGSYPPPAAVGGRENLLSLVAGREEHVDMTLEKRPSHSVGVTVKGLEDGSFPQFSARLPSGSTLRISQRGPNEILVPDGAYTLVATTNSAKGQFRGEARVEVAGRDVNGVVVNMEPLPAIPVELTLDTSGQSSAASNTYRGPGAPGRPLDARQLGLYLLPLSGTVDGYTQPQYMNLQAASGFQVSPGQYLLRSQLNLGSLYVRSATYGSTDLLREPLTVAAGSGSSPIRITVSSATGSLTGSVQLGGQPAVASLALVPEFPSLRPITVIRSSSTGLFTASGLPPGPYRVLATERESRLVFEAAFAGKPLPFLAAAQEVTVVAGDNPPISLSAVAERDLFAAETPR